MTEQAKTAREIEVDRLLSDLRSTPSPFTHKPAPVTAAGILDLAGSIVTGTCQDEYGAPERNFDRIAQMWTAFLGFDVTPAQVCWMMVLLKASRAASGTAVADNAVDACGYAALAGEMEATA